MAETKPSNAGDGVVENVANDERQADSTTADGDPKNARRPLKWWTLLAVLSVLFFIAALNAPYEYLPLGKSGNKPTDDFDLEIDESFQGTVVEAGWPMRYYVHHDFADNLNSSQWFVSAGLINVAIGLASMGIIFWYFHKVKGRAMPAKASSKRISLSLADLLLLVGLIALSMGYWQREKGLMLAEVQIEKQISTIATVHREQLVPKLISNHMPHALKNYWTRITRVSVESPDDKTVDLICRLPNLRSLRLGGGDYDLAPLRRLPSMRYLADLRVAGRSFDAATVQAISQCKLVSHLNIANTNCTNAALDQLGQMPRLKKLIAFGCANDYEAWQTTSLKNNVEELYFDRPDTGQGGEVVLRDWPKLRKLYIQSRDQFLNQVPFSITIDQVPELEYVELDVFQLFDLAVQNAPKLTTVEGIRRNTFRRVADGDRAPCQLWVRSMRFSDAPLLEELHFNCKDFESLAIDGCPNLESIDATSLSQLGSGATEYDLTYGKEVMQRLVNALGDLDGPETLRLEGHRIDELDLSVLEKNVGLQHIGFSGSVVSIKNIQAISGMDQITGLWFGNARVQPKFLGEVNKHFPGLRTVEVNETASAIRMENKPRLQAIDFDDYGDSVVYALRLIDLPELVSPMVVNDYGQYCVVKNVPKLKGLAVLNSIPTAEVSGVGGLQWFVASGETANDNVVREVLKAKDLQSLTLAYPTASKEAFAGLTKLTKLTKLALPAAPLDDDLVRQWQMPAMLYDLNLDDCQLSEQTVKRILERGGWTRLSLKGNQMSADLLPLLGKSQLLYFLSLGEIDLDMAAMGLMPDMRDLHTLDLSGSKIGKGVFAEIAKKCFQLAELHLVGATFDNKEFLAFARQHPQMMFDLEPTDATVETITSLTKARRLIHQEAVLRRKMMRVVVGHDAAGRPVFQQDSQANKTEFEEPELDLWEVRSNIQLRSTAFNRNGRFIPSPGMVGGTIILDESSEIDTDSEDDVVEETEATVEDNDNAASILGRAFGLLLGGSAERSETGVEMDVESADTNDTALETSK